MPSDVRVKLINDMADIKPTALPLEFNASLVNHVLLMILLRLTSSCSSRDESFFEASPWLDSDCEDDFFGVNGDHTPARTFSRTPNNNNTPFGPHKLPTLEDILKADPLKAPPQVKLADLLQEKQEGGNAAAPEDLCRNNSSRVGEEASQRCIPHFARAISYKERRKHK